MRSGELARLAGVTVRALRHYHEVGVLPEPRRDSNDYRNYDMHDLVRLLRIKRLAAVGIPLERMPDLLDDSPGDTGALMDELDAELAEQIDRLTSQRALIAHLREHRVAPDLPPELAPFVAMFAAADLPPELMRFDRDQTVLLAHLAGEAAMPHLTRFYQRISDPTMVPLVSAVVGRFSRLGADSTDQEISSVVDSFTTTFHGLVTEFAEQDLLDLGSADLVSEHTADLLNEQQLQALAQIEARFAAP
ncbi:MerR family transcriptional regulator [Promicromonospora vindobonensis]|uniref:MerR family transcriptional regulator n=1 Tax=Promicromonospora vindobonensis TaxID=195748 RepID=A0ABW5VZT9_9MICO